MFVFNRFILMLALVVVNVPALAQDFEPPWRDEAFSYYGSGESLSEALRNFGTSVETKIVISPNLKGNISGSYFAATPKIFLEDLSKSYGFIWYYDGGALYIYDASELTAETLRSETLNALSLRRRLLTHPLWDKRYEIDALVGTHEVIIHAPPRLAELAHDMVRSFDVSDDGAIYESRLFRLRYAWATDKHFTSRGQKVTMPGVVTLLKKIYGGQPSQNPAPQEEEQSDLDGILEKKQKEEVGATQNPPTQDAHHHMPHVRIEADTRLNAIIVHAPRRDMARYQSLIESLDAPSGLIEIEAMVIDVSISKSHELGIAWRYQDNRRAVGYGAIPNDIGVGDVVANIGAGVNFSTLAASGARQFLSRISALKSEGNARVMSRPSVLTIDNFEAVLDLHQTFHVRVAGEKAVDLYPITTGTLLRVTPHIIANHKDRAIQLAINIEDGSILAEEVDEIPIIRNNIINTQAIIGEHESLLIGGHYYESESDSEDGIPILQDIPLIGLLFSRERTERTQIERLYLITPRIIALPSYMLQKASKNAPAKKNP